MLGFEYFPKSSPSCKQTVITALFRYFSFFQYIDRVRVNKSGGTVRNQYHGLFAEDVFIRVRRTIDTGIRGSTAIKITAETG